MYSGQQHAWPDYFFPLYHATTNDLLWRPCILYSSRASVAWQNINSLFMSIDCILAHWQRSPSAYGPRCKLHSRPAPFIRMTGGSGTSFQLVGHPFRLHPAVSPLHRLVTAGVPHVSPALTRVPCWEGDGAFNAFTFSPSCYSGLARRSRAKLWVPVPYWMDHLVTKFKKNP